MSKQTLSDDIGHQTNYPTQTLSSEIKNVLDKLIPTELSDDINTKTKCSYYLQLAEQFEIEGIKKTEISKYTLKIIEDALFQKLSSEGIPKEQCKLSVSSVRHLRRTLSDAEYTDPFYARNTKDVSKKYEYEEENKTLIDLFSSQRDIIPDIIHWLNHNEYCAKLPQKQFDEFIITSKQNHQNFYDVFNNKEKLIPAFQAIFNYYINTEVSLAYTIAIYLEKIKTIGTISRKQAVRCQKRLLKGIHPTLSPNDYGTAVYLGFLGQQCPNCEGFKVVDNETGHLLARCIDCSVSNSDEFSGVFSRVPTLKCQYCHTPLYISDLKTMSNNDSKCPACDNENNVPESIYDKLESVI